MINNYFYIFIVPLILLINFILKKNKFLLNYTGQEHQIYAIKNRIPLSGGLFILVFFIINYESLGFNLFFYLFFFLLGLFADLNVVKSGKIIITLGIGPELIPEFAKGGFSRFGFR